VRYERNEITKEGVGVISFLRLFRTGEDGQ